MISSKHSIVPRMAQGSSTTTKDRMVFVRPQDAQREPSTSWCPVFELKLFLFKPVFACGAGVVWFGSFFQCYDDFRWSAKVGRRSRCPVDGCSCSAAREMALQKAGLEAALRRVKEQTKVGVSPSRVPVPVRLPRPTHPHTAEWTVNCRIGG